MDIAAAPAPAATAASPPAARWEDFVDIFLEPRSVFERRRDGRFALALVVATLAMTLLFFASLGPLAPVFENEMMRGVEMARESGQAITPEQIDAIHSSTRIFGTLSLLVSVPVGVLLTGTLIWLLGRLLAPTSFVLAVTIATYAIFPRILQSAAGILQGLLLEPRRVTDLSVGPARFFEPDSISAPVTALLVRFDLFTLWVAALTMLGVMVIARVPARRAALVAGLVWLLSAAPPLVAALART